MRAIALLALLPLVASPALAAERVTVDSPWVREAPPTATVLAAYMTLRGAPTGGDRLLNLRTPAARRVEIHAMRMLGGVMRMSPLGSLEIPAGKTVKLEPGGSHVMLIDPVKPLKAGDTVTLILHFAKSGDKKVVAPVRAYQD